MSYFNFSEVNIGSLVFYTWGVFLFLGFWIGIFIFEKKLKIEKKFLTVKEKYQLYFSLVFGGIIGAKVFYLLQFLFFGSIDKIDFFSGGGLVFYGGLFGGMAALWAWTKFYGLNFKYFAGLLVLPLLAGIFFTRFGCFLINDHQGALTNLPWAIEWPDGSLRHPVALYLMLDAVLAFFILKKADISKRAEYFLIWHTMARFFLDFMRTREGILADPNFYNLTMSQWVSLFILIAVVILNVFRIKKY